MLLCCRSKHHKEGTAFLDETLAKNLQVLIRKIDEFVNLQSQKKDAVKKIKVAKSNFSYVLKR